MKNKLGTLEEVELRTLWVNEARDFTPWLAIEENIDRLGEEVGLDLLVEGVEKEVGPFRADILCRNTQNDALVLIENQLEKTDHKHLGQVMTYAAGLDTATIIWIAGQFTDEHRATLDWLNRITDEGFNFFGVEVKAFKIGESLPAPKFNVISKPNDWSKSVKKSAANLPLSDTKKLQLQFWEGLKGLIESHDSPLICQTPRPQHTTNFKIGRSHFHLTAFANMRDKRIGVMLVMGSDKGTEHFNRLKELCYEESLTAIDKDLKWNENPEGKESHVKLRKYVDPAEVDNWPEQHQWLKGKLEQMYRFFGPKVKQI